MPLYQLLKPDQTEPFAEIIARDGGGVLAIVKQHGAGEADVLQDGYYSFSARLNGSGMWVIFKRPFEQGLGVTAFG